MRLLRSLLDRSEPLFSKGGRFERLWPLFEGADSFLYTPGKVTAGAPHVRDGLDLKRLMSTVVVALIGCIAMALYNTGFQANQAIARGAAPLETWQSEAMRALGLSFDPTSLWACLLHGALYFLPVLVATLVVGGAWEALFAVVRRHDINEGFLVTWVLFALILPPTIPLWQVALGISFGVVLGKEIFGGTGFNVLNPALTARAFLFFAYPAQISGDQVWIAAQTSADAASGATWLARFALEGPSAVGAEASWWDAFVGLVPGSMGETSALACLAGAALLVLTGIGSWRIMLGSAAGTAVMALILNAVGSQTNPFFAVPFWWHYVLGGWAFGTAFMATDPVSAPACRQGHWLYGVSIGVLVVLVRVVNPAYPEGMMLAILFMNLFAPLIDHYVAEANIKRRRARHAG
jgi:Na+-transporting NADH:ubiquinone oxidoreductase subunit B